MVFNSRGSIRIRKKSDGSSALHAPVQYGCIAGLFVKEESNDAEIQHRQPEVHRSKVLVLLHEKVCAVADVEVGHDKGQLGQWEEEVREGVVGWDIAGCCVLTNVIAVVVAGIPERKKDHNDYRCDGLFKTFTMSYNSDS